MSTKFYFRSLKVRNFRAFSALELDQLKRINIISGFNGAGKTSLLETMFFILDRRNPLAVVKPIQWRKIDTQTTIDPAQLLKSIESPSAEIEAAHRDGTTLIELLYQKPPQSVSLSIATSIPPMDLGVTDTSQKGLVINTSFDGGAIAEQTFVMPAPNGAIGNISKTSDRGVPTAQIIGASTIGGAQEVAARLTTIIKNKMDKELVSGLKILYPDLNGLQILQDGVAPAIYADINGELMLVQYLGDGFQNLFRTLVGLYTVKDGVLFLDETDSAIHYSLRAKIWQIIARLADEQNCQIFATTHSRECIFSVAEGVKLAGRDKDFQYIRLESFKDKKFGVYYSMEDLQEAAESNVEVR